MILTGTVSLTSCNFSSADPDQTPGSATSDLGLHCLPMS